MSEVAVTAVGLAELARIQALAHAIWPEAYDGILPAERIPGMLAEIYALDTLKADIEVHGHQYWIATDAEGDLGFASAYTDARRIWIKKLYVHARARGSGIGKRCIALAQAHFGADLPVALFVNDGNAPAIAFYRAQGFEVERQVPVRMGPYDFTDYVMVRPALEAGRATS